MRAVRLKTLAKQFKIPNKGAYDALLAYSNFTNKKVLHYTDGDTLVVSGDLHDEMEDIHVYIQEWIYDRERIISESFDKIPFDLEPRIYFLLQDRMIVYIGKSIKLTNRIGQHLDNKKFNLVTTFPVVKDDLDIIEKVNIQRYLPQYNKEVMTDMEYFKWILRKIG